MCGPYVARMDRAGETSEAAKYAITVLSVIVLFRLYRLHHGLRVANGCWKYWEDCFQWREAFMKTRWLTNGAPFQLL